MRFQSILISVIFLVLLPTVAMPQDRQREKAISIYCSILNKKPLVLSKYFGSEVHYADQTIPYGYYGKFAKQNNYDGFTRNSGKLFSLLYSEKELFPSSVTPPYHPLLSFRSAFQKATILEYFCLDGKCDRDRDGYIYSPILGVGIPSTFPAKSGFGYFIQFECKKIDQCTIQEFVAQSSWLKPSDDSQKIDLQDKSALCGANPKPIPQ